MKRDQRLENFTMTAFSIEMLSRGRQDSLYFLAVTSSQSVLSRDELLE